MIMKNVFLVTDTDTIISGRLTQKINACIASEESVQLILGMAQYKDVFKAEKTVKKLFGKNIPTTSASEIYRNSPGVAYNNIREPLDNFRSSLISYDSKGKKYIEYFNSSNEVEEAHHYTSQDKLNYIKFYILGNLSETHYFKDNHLLAVDYFRDNKPTATILFNQSKEMVFRIVHEKREMIEQEKNSEPSEQEKLLELIVQLQHTHNNAEENVSVDDIQDATQIENNETKVTNAPQYVITQRFEGIDYVNQVKLNNRYEFYKELIEQLNLNEQITLYVDEKEAIDVAITLPNQLVFNF